MAAEPDDDVLRRFVEGDRDAFEWLFRQFEGEVHYWIRRIVRDPAAAEDGVIEAFWRAYRGRARFDPSRSFGAWMRRIATNVARDALKTARRQPVSALDAARVAAPAALDAAVGAAVARAFARLSPRLHIVATLALIEECPYSEIADALEVPIGTVKSRVFRAIRALRRELIDLGVER